MHTHTHTNLSIYTAANSYSSHCSALSCSAQPPLPASPHFSINSTFPLFSFKPVPAFACESLVYLLLYDALTTGFLEKEEERRKKKIKTQNLPLSRK